MEASHYIHVLRQDLPEILIIAERQDRGKSVKAQSTTEFKEQ